MNKITSMVKNINIDIFTDLILIKWIVPVRYDKTRSVKALMFNHIGCHI